MDGIVVIDKEPGMSSHDVVAKLRHILGTKRIGHTGTLDPIATGVLVACVGRATKLVQYLTCDDKVYEVEMKFGIKTDTGDRTGEIIETSNKNINESRLKWVLKSFIGPQKQVPPMYSAIKVNGKKLYEYARAGETIYREPRDIEIFSIDNVEFNKEEKILKYRIYCSKGTYVRTVCECIANRLGTVGTMTELRRVQAGQFIIDQAVKLEDVTEDSLIKLDELYDDEISLKKDGIFKLVNGMPIYMNLPDGIYKIYHDNYYNKKFIGLGRIEAKYLYREIIL